MRVTQKESSRDRLLVAARELFAEHGFEAATTAALARRANTSQSQLLKYSPQPASRSGAIMHMSALPIPERSKAILQRSCKDCHSNETTWPWVGAAWETRQVVCFSDVAAEPRFARSLVAKMDGLHMGIAFPAYRLRRVFGVFEFQYRSASMR